MEKKNFEMISILYTSDLHGNEIQYKKLVNYAKENSVDFIMIGGDIAPNKFSKDTYVKKQKEFLGTRLPELIKPLKNSNTGLFLMMGNDDCSANLDVLEKHEKGQYQMIHNKRIKLADNFDLVGYSFVPITPFSIKDWEKYDLSNAPARLQKDYLKRKIENYRLEGFKSMKKGWKMFEFTSEIEKKDSIQNDFLKTMFKKNPDKTVYVIHSPPSNTNLDQVAGGYHVGSMAVRLFIETFQPYLTLHGHIHETVEVSGDFKDRIGKTLCLSSGNKDTLDSLAVLIFDLHNPKNVKRILI